VTTQPGFKDGRRVLFQNYHIIRVQTQICSHRSGWRCSRFSPDLRSNSCCFRYHLPAAPLKIRWRRGSVNRFVRPARRGIQGRQNNVSGQHQHISAVPQCHIRTIKADLSPRKSQANTKCKALGNYKNSSNPHYKVFHPKDNEPFTRAVPKPSDHKTTII